MLNTNTLNNPVMPVIEEDKFNMDIDSIVTPIVAEFTVSPSDVKNKEQILDFMAETLSNMFMPFCF